MPISIQSFEYKKYLPKKNAITPVTQSCNKNFLLPPQSAELIKLSTVNCSGIYLPPSPNDELNNNQDYFDFSETKETFQLPCDDKLTRKRQFYTPSHLL